MKEHIRNGLALIVTIGVFLMVGALFYLPIPNGNKDVVNIAVGSLMGNMAGVLGFYFASSYGKKQEKDGTAQ